MKLSQLLDFDVTDEVKNLEIIDIADDSRKVVKGGMFVAINGNASDGALYIEDAVKKGAACVVINSDIAGKIFRESSGNNSIYNKDGVVFIVVENSRKFLANVCARFWRSNFENVIAVTGTNGKSSTVDIVRQILNFANKPAASVGTLGIITEKYRKDNGGLTSPGAVALHQIFHQLNEEGIQNIAIEASSHGIDQHRIDAIPFSVCAFTNFTQDHLDYHHSFENYWNAKAGLFKDLATENTTFVINSDDDASFQKLVDIANQKNVKLISYGKKSDDIKLLNYSHAGQHQNVEIEVRGVQYSFKLPLAGEFQIYNALCSLGICLSAGLDADFICESLEKLTPINGRLEYIAEKNGAHIYIDYAHTPDALQKAIQSLRKHTKNRLIVVFGCGGNRDSDKRSLMGEVAAKYADLTIVTDDNPRKENPAEIRKMILRSCVGAVEIENRRNAIEYAIKQLQFGDVLLIAGKGHETYQILHDETIYFSDKETILEVLS